LTKGALEAARRMRTWFDGCCASWNRRASFQMNKSSNLITSNALHYAQEAHIQSTLRDYSFEKFTGRLWVPQRSSDHSIYPRSPICSALWYPQLIPPLVILCQNLHTLDYKHRKFLLECTRVQKRIGSNQHLSREFSALLSSAYRIYLSPRTFQALIQQEFLPRSYCVDYIDSRKLCSLFDNLYDDPLGCSLLSYLTRAE